MTEHQNEDGRTPDLVERLRDPDLWHRDELEYIDPLAKEAATEIKRLRAKLAEHKAIHDDITEVFESNGYVHCGNADGVKMILDRAVLAEAQLSHLEMANLHNDERARAAEKRLAEARAVIAPLVKRYNEIMKITRGRRWATYVDTAHLRAAAEWMEKNQ